MDQTKFRRGYKLAERMWKEGGVTEEKISATLLKLLEDNDPAVLYRGMRIGGSPGLILVVHLPIYLL